MTLISPKRLRSDDVLFVSFQLSLFGWALLNASNLELPVLGSVIVVVLLTFGPGAVLIAALDLQLDRLTDYVLFAVGLSLVFLMAVGLFVNVTYPWAGIDRPLATIPLISTIIVGLTPPYLVYVRRRRSGMGSYLPISATTVSARMVRYSVPLLTLPFTVILVVSHGNATGNYVFTLPVILCLVALLPLVHLTRFPARLYPLTIWSLSISLLFLVTMVTSHIVGWDIHYQFSTAQLVRTELIWRPHVDLAGNALLSIVVVPVIYSVLAGIELAWVFKLVVPLFFSLAPLCVYRVSINVFDCPEVGVLAAFLFASYYGFFKDMPDKQHISVLFLGLTLVVTTHPDLRGSVRAILASAFLGGIVASHYGTSFLLMGVFAPVVFANALLASPSNWSLLVHLRKALLDDKLHESLSTYARSPVVTLHLWILFVILTIGWYGYAAGGARLSMIIGVAYETFAGLDGLFTARSGADYATRELPGPLWEIYRLMNVALVGLIGLGIVFVGIRAVVLRRFVPYHFLAFGSFGLLIAVVALPLGIGFDRILQLTLLVLAPYAVLSAAALFDWARNIASLTYNDRVYAVFDGRAVYSTLSVFIAIYLLFSSGAAFAMVGDENQPYAIYLDDDQWEEWNVAYPSERAAAEWTRTTSPNSEVASVPGPPNYPWHNKDYMVLSGYYPQQTDIIPIWTYTVEVPDGTCIYLGLQMAREDEMPYYDADDLLDTESVSSTTFYTEVLQDSNGVYDSGTAEVYGC